MESTDWAALQNLILHLPVALVWLAGLGVAAATWRRHPAVSALAAAGLVLMFLLVLGSVGFNYWLLRSIRNGSTSADVTVYGWVYGVANALVGAAAWILVLAAVFGWRARRPAEPPPFGR